MTQLKCNRFNPIKAIGAGVAILVFSTSLCSHSGQAQGFSGYKTHTVQAGQSLWSISSKECPKDMDVRKYIFKVREVNCLDSAVIFPGQVLKLPKGVE